MQGSGKNLVQEFCQKRAISFPSYDTNRIEGSPDHLPIFKCFLSFSYGGRNFFHETTGSNKRDAESKAASLLYEEICSFINESGYSAAASAALVPEIFQIRAKNILDLLEKIEKYSVLIFCDPDNLFFEFNDLKKMVGENFYLIYFVAKNSTRLEHILNQERNNYNCNVLICNSIGKDAADHFMSFSLGLISGTIGAKEIIYIFTKDHFGEILSSFIPESKFICSISEIGRE